MTAATHLRRSLASWALCVAALWLALSGDVAWATCGDYLMIGGEEHYQPQDMPAGRDSHEGPLPCDGASCRNMPHAPLPTAPERSITYDLERWCASLADDVHSAQSRSHLEMNETLLIPAGYASRIDRPPRV